MRLDIAKLNLEAGRGSMASVSFGRAAKYFETAIECLPQDRCASEYEFNLEFYSSAAEAEYGAGDVKSMEDDCNEIVIRRNRPVSDESRAYNVLIPSIGNRNRIHQACDTLVEVLEELGCRLSKPWNFFFVLNGVMAAVTALKKHEPGDFTTSKK